MIIQGKKIGSGQPVFFIAEAGVNHNGSWEIAKKLIDAAVSAGADAVKFQTFKTENIIIPSAPKSTYHIKTTGSDNDQTWFELLKTQEITREMHISLMEYCDKRGIIFMSTPYDNDSIDLLDELNVPAFKIASTDTNNLSLLRYAAKKGKPIILSSAMSTMEEVINAVNAVRECDLDEVAMLQCTGNYPSALEDSNLNIMNTYLKKLNCIVGYSDHTIGMINPIAATALGASIYEKHITIDKSLPGPDHEMALSPTELNETIKLIRLTERALGSNTKKVLNSEIENRQKLRKSIVAKSDIFPGKIIEEDDIAIKRPGTGMDPSLLSKLLGRKAKVQILANTMLKMEMVQ